MTKLIIFCDLCWVHVLCVSIPCKEYTCEQKKKKKDAMLYREMPLETFPYRTQLGKSYLTTVSTKVFLFYFKNIVAKLPIW